MSRHFGKSGHSHRWVVIATVVCVALAVVAYVLHGMFGQGEGASSSNQDGTTSGTATVSTEPGDTDGLSLPFSIEGVPSDATILDVSEGTETSALEGEWTFGGDYTKIGSFPIDSDTVFGSCTDNPDDLTSYVAALIMLNGATPLEERQIGETVYEPQDGTGSAQGAVWRSSVLSLSPTTGADDWRLQAWSAATGTVDTLGTARDLNGENDTPLLDGEIVPTENESNAFFASWYLNQGTWTPTVISYALNEVTSTPTLIDTGSYPAATDGGVIYAGSPAATESTTLYKALHTWDTSSSSTVFTVVSEGNDWGISGVWAYGDRRAVCLSSDKAADGCYIGFWDGSFSTNITWLHMASPSVVASMNESWLVWGSGSQADNAGMYAYNLESNAIEYLGSAIGYSRPVIASENNTVLVPESDGQGAVIFHVGTLS